jgi:hypothetical protein
MVISAASVRALIARWGGEATLKRGAVTCTVLAAIVPAGALQGQSTRPGSFITRDVQTAIISAIDESGTPIAISPAKDGDRIERGAQGWTLRDCKVIDPDGSGPVAFIAEVHA